MAFTLVAALVLLALIAACGIFVMVVVGIVRGKQRGVLVNPSSADRAAYLLGDSSRAQPPEAEPPRNDA